MAAENNMPARGRGRGNHKEEILKLHGVIRAAASAALSALLVAGAGLFPAQTVAGQETNSVTSLGEAAAEQSEQGGQDQGLRAALNQARYSVTHAVNTPLGRWAWHAPNPTAGYDAYITEAGVTIVVNGEPCVSLNLRAFGYGAGLRAVAPGEVSADKQTINLTRDGSVQEWYVNSPDGLEQGFTFAEPPAGRRPGVPLRLAFQVGEGAQATASADARQVSLRGADGRRVVEYGKLAVHDRKGRGIPARLTADGEEVFIEVEDGEAAYPLTIDPVFTLQEKLPAEDTTLGDYFGYAVELQGDTAVVGAYNDDIGSNPDQGSVYVFIRDGGVWSLQQKLTAADGGLFDGFGNAVALSGDTAAVGAYHDAVGSNVHQGSVYVFTRDDGVWSLQQKLTAADGGIFDGFGNAVALSGDTLVVGARDATVGANYGQGSAYVFTRSNGVWTQQQKLNAPDGSQEDNFGISVALSGDTAAVGAHRDDVGSNVDEGSAYFFTSTGGAWTFQQKLTAPNGIGDFQDAYGISVALNEGTLAVGAYHAAAGFLGNHGVVYIYARGHTGWVLEKRLAAADRESGDGFGFSVALSGETLAVGALYADIGTNYNQGAVYVYTRGGGAWPQQQKLTAGDGATSDVFGLSVSLSGDTLVAGAWNDDIGEKQDQGSASVFRRGDGVWTEQQKLTAGDGEGWEYFGNAVAVSGDTVLVGAVGDTVGEENYGQGSAYVFHLPTCPTLMFKPLELPNGLSNVAYEQAVTVSGGAGPYEFMHIAGSLPPGISLSTSGVLSGTPTAAGTYHFTLVATDLGSGCGSVRDYTLMIE